ncbi:MAG TPA: serine protein kinase RIO [Candidatus Thermoplasmatota archaeon]|nr:serine protein kinase RIO [Candidatus Thermoplasmatota archaeon]
MKRERLVEAMDLLEGEGMWKRSGTGDKRKILDEVFDERTLKALHKLMNAGILQTLDFPVATGKEATVFVGLTKKADEVAVKVYRVGNATFNSIRRYIQDDPRFKAVGRDRRSVIFAWAVKEYKNLLRMHEAGVTVPSPVAHLENVLVMEYLFVGDGHEPAPSLKGARGFDAPAVYEALRKDVRRMVAKARLVHGDLSEYNVLLAEGRPHIIDVGQAVVLDHPRAKEFLRRDAENVARFFGRLKVGEGAADLYEFWSHGVSFERRRGRGRAGGEEE